MALKLDYVARETAGNLYRNLSITVATVLTVAVSLAMVGFGFMVRDGVQNATQRWEGGIEFVVFMQPDATQDQIDAVAADLDESPAIEEWVYFDKDAACEEFEELFAGDEAFIEAVECDILPTSYRIVPVDKDADAVKLLGQEYASQPGVREVVFASDTIKAVQSLARKVNLFIFALAIILLGAAIVLIVNTIRMAAFARRREIEVQKLVGATNWFIRVPFMMEGLIQGLVGALLACFAVWWARPFLEELFRDQRIPLVEGFMISNSEMAFIYLVILAAGAGIGAIGAGIAVTRFMDV